MKEIEDILFLPWRLTMCLFLCGWDTIEQKGRRCFDCWACAWSFQSSPSEVFWGEERVDQYAAWNLYAAWIYFITWNPDALSEQPIPYILDCGYYLRILQCLLFKEERGELLNSYHDFPPLFQISS